MAPKRKHATENLKVYGAYVYVARDHRFVPHSGHAGGVRAPNMLVAADRVLTEGKGVNTLVGLSHSSKGKVRVALYEVDPSDGAVRRVADKANVKREAVADELLRLYDQQYPAKPVSQPAAPPSPPPPPPPKKRRGLRERLKASTRLIGTLQRVRRQQQSAAEAKEAESRRQQQAEEEDSAIEASRQLDEQEEAADRDRRERLQWERDQAEADAFEAERAAQAEADAQAAEEAAEAERREAQERQDAERRRKRRQAELEAEEKERRRLRREEMERQERQAQQDREEREREAARRDQHRRERMRAAIREAEARQRQQRQQQQQAEEEARRRAAQREEEDADATESEDEEEQEPAPPPVVPVGPVVRTKKGRTQTIRGDEERTVRRWERLLFGRREVTDSQVVPEPDYEMTLGDYLSAYHAAASKVGQPRKWDVVERASGDFVFVQRKPPQSRKPVPSPSAVRRVVSPFLRYMQKLGAERIGRTLYRLGKPVGDAVRRQLLALQGDVYDVHSSASLSSFTRLDTFVARTGTPKVTQKILAWIKKQRETLRAPGLWPWYGSPADVPQWLVIQERVAGERGARAHVFDTSAWKLRYEQSRGSARTFSDYAVLQPIRRNRRPRTVTQKAAMERYLSKYASSSATPAKEMTGGGGRGVVQRRLVPTFEPLGPHSRRLVAMRIGGKAVADVAKGAAKGLARFGSWIARGAKSVASGLKKGATAAAAAGKKAAQAVKRGATAAAAAAKKAALAVKRGAIKAAAVAKRAAQAVKRGAIKAAAVAKRAAQAVKRGATKVLEVGKRAAQAVKRGATRAAQVVKRGATRAAQAVKRGAQRVKQAATSVAKSVKRGAQKVKEAASRGVQSVKKAATRAKKALTGKNGATTATAAVATGAVAAKVASSPSSSSSSSSSSPPPAKSSNGQQRSEPPQQPAQQRERQQDLPPQQPQSRERSEGDRALEDMMKKRLAEFCADPANTARCVELASRLSSGGDPMAMLQQQRPPVGGRYRRDRYRF